MLNTRTTCLIFSPCLIGVRQGEILSPFLFSIFVNDLDTFFMSLDGIPLEQLRSKCEEMISTYVEIFLLLYADDTVLIAETKENLQRNLDIFYNYCEFWQLSVNTNKTKILIFSKRKVKNAPNFFLNGKILEIVDSYSYLGLLFNFNGNFSKAKSSLVNRARRSLFSVYKRIRNQPIPIDLQLKLFDSIVEPILLYGSEVWGFENLLCIEKIHLQFCKKKSSI